MSKLTDGCYDRSQWNLFAEEALPEKLEQQFIAHLDTCQKCQAELEMVVGSQDQWESVCKKLSNHGLDQFALSQSFEWKGPGGRISDRNGAGQKEDESRFHFLDHSHGVKRLLETLTPSEHPRSVGRIGCYDVVGLIGQGSAGIVLKAWDPKLHRFVAVKVLSPSFSDNGPARRRFQREAKAIAAVSHQHVVPIHAVHEFQSLPFIVMPYLAGGSLQQRIEKQGTLKTEEIVRISLQICQGLAAAHDQGIVHRDVKPANVLLEEGVDRALVSDFGLARVSDDAAATRSGVIAGTPHYMSPEQAKGDCVDNRSDLFSLGGVMYFACTGRLPFESDSIFGVIKKVCDSTPESILKLNPDIAPWLADFIGVLHQKEKEMRFHTAAEVADLLQAELAYHNNPKVVPKPDRSKYQRVPSWKRRRATVTASVLFVAAIGLGTIAAAGLTTGKSPLGFAWAPNSSQSSGQGFPATIQEKQKKDQKQGPQRKGTAAPKSAGQRSSAAAPTTPARPNTKPLQPSAPLSAGAAAVSPARPLQPNVPKFPRRLTWEEIKKTPKYESVVKHSSNVQAGGTLFVQSDQADLEITFTDAPKVTFEVVRSMRTNDKKQADHFFANHSVDFKSAVKGSQEGRDAVVKSELSEAYKKESNAPGRRTYVSRNVVIRVAIPQKFHVNVKTAAGDLALPFVKEYSGKEIAKTKELQGNIDFFSAAGDVELGKIDGDVRVKTIGGDLSIFEAKKTLNFETLGGDLFAKTLHGKSVMKTTGGDIDVGEVFQKSEMVTQGGDIAIEKARDGVTAITTGGDVQVRFFGQVKSPSKIKTTAGEIDVEVPREMNCHLKAVNRFGHFPARKKKGRKNAELKIGTGQPLIEMETQVGEIDYGFFGSKRKPGQKKPAQKKPNKWNPGKRKPAKKKPSKGATPLQGLKPNVGQASPAAIASPARKAKPAKK